MQTNYIISLHLTPRITSASRATTTAEMQGISSASWNITRIMVKTFRSFNWNKKAIKLKFWQTVKGTGWYSTEKYSAKYTWIGIDATSAASTAKIILGSPPQRKSMSIMIWPLVRLCTRIPVWMKKLCIYEFLACKAKGLNRTIDKGEETQECYDKLHLYNIFISLTECYTSKSAVNNNLINAAFQYALYGFLTKQHYCH